MAKDKVQYKNKNSLKARTSTVRNAKASSSPAINETASSLKVGSAKESELKILSLLVRNFCEDRAWDPHHGLKDLAIGLVTESSELLELTRFQSESDIETHLQKSKYRENLSDELADVFFFLLRLSDRYGFDLHKSLVNKIAKNNLKYPVEKARGSNKKYDEL